MLHNNLRGLTIIKDFLSQFELQAKGSQPGERSLKS